MSGAGGNREINQHWLNRWETGDIGWHHQEFNNHLISHWPNLSVPTGSTIMIPLCGKSRDMAWLRDKGYKILGIEVSPLAVRSFFEENRLEPSRTQKGAFESWQADDFEILCGDIFDLRKEHTGQVSAVYDRASLVALNPDQRKQFSRLLQTVLPADSQVLLVAMDYPQSEMAGPPYSVPDNEVFALFGRHFDVTQLDHLDLLADSDRYQNKGLSRLHESIYALRKHTPETD